MQFVTCPVHTIVVGQASSMASLILAGGKFEALPNPCREKPADPTRLFSFFSLSSMLLQVNLDKEVHWPIHRSWFIVSASRNLFCLSSQPLDRALRFSICRTVGRSWRSSFRYFHHCERLTISQLPNRIDIGIIVQANEILRIREKMFDLCEFYHQWTWEQLQSLTATLRCRRCRSLHSSWWRKRTC